MNHHEASPRAHETIDKTQKILGLQEQLLNLRKQMSKKQSLWQKQRSNLLSKNQVANIQIIELKQRISNLSKINQTLSSAMTNQTQPSLKKQKPEIKLKKPKPISIGTDDSNIEFSNDSPNYDGDSRRSYKYQEEIRKLNKIINEKDFQIANLNKICSQLRGKIQQRNSFVSGLQENCFNFKKKIQKKEEQILKLHRQIQDLQDKLQQNNEYIDQTRRQSNKYSQVISKKALNIKQLTQSPECDRKYRSKNSSYLIMKPTPDHSGFDMDNNSSYCQQSQQLDDGDNSQQEKLLCEVCNRVYTFGQFEQHAQYCGYKVVKDQGMNRKNVRQLFEKKKQIQQKLQKIRIQQQKQNIKRYYKNETNKLEFQFQERDKSSRDKINQIRQIAKGLNANKKEYKKNHCNDFSIKTNPYFY